MKKMIFAALALSCVTATALTLKEQKSFKETQDYLKDPDKSYMKSAKDKCGIDIPVTVEEKMVTPFMAENTSLPSYCDAPRSAISGMCEDETSKNSIKKSIKKIECKLGAKEKVDFKLNGTTLVFTVGIGASNLEQKTRDFLENNLK